LLWNLFRFKFTIAQIDTLIYLQRPPEPLVKPLFAEPRETQETTMQSRSTKKSAVVVLTDKILRAKPRSILLLEKPGRFGTGLAFFEETNRFSLAVELGL